MLQAFIKNDKIVIKINVKSIDVFTSFELAKFLFDLPIDENERVVIDMEHVKDIDSSGLGQLIKYYRHLKKGNNSLALANCSVKVDYVLNATNINTMIPVCSSVDDVK